VASLQSSLFLVPLAHPPSPFAGTHLPFPPHVFKVEPPRAGRVRQEGRGYNYVLHF
jgi:hypothetical protein